MDCSQVQVVWVIPVSYVGVLGQREHKCWRYLGLKRQSPPILQRWPIGNVPEKNKTLSTMRKGIGRTQKASLSVVAVLVSLLVSHWGKLVCGGRGGNLVSPLVRALVSWGSWSLQVGQSACRSVREVLLGGTQDSLAVTRLEPTWNTSVKILFFKPAWTFAWE